MTSPILVAAAAAAAAAAAPASSLQPQPARLGCGMHMCVSVVDSEPEKEENEGGGERSRKAEEDDDDEFRRRWKAMQQQLPFLSLNPDHHLVPSSTNQPTNQPTQDLLPVHRPHPLVLRLEDRRATCSLRRGPARPLLARRGAGGARGGEVGAGEAAPLLQVRGEEGRQE
jgi:hypothetical protein